MSLWGTLDNPTGNNKPKFANVSSVYGVSADEMSSTEGKKVPHQGWVKRTVGYGPISGIVILDGGSGVNSNGFIVVTDNSDAGTGTGANISYTTANVMNTMQSSSTNPNWNTIHTITVVDGGELYSESSNIEFSITSNSINSPSFSATLGGRGDRTKYETLVAVKIVGDDPADDGIFPQ